LGDCIWRGFYCTKIYWSYWDFLELRNDVIYKRWEAPNLKDFIAQLIVPKSQIQQFRSRRITLPKDILRSTKPWRRFERDSTGLSVNGTSKISVGPIIFVSLGAVQREKGNHYFRFITLKLRLREFKWTYLIHSLRK